MKIPLRVLIIEDSEDDKELLLRELSQAGYDPQYLCVATRKALNIALDEQNWDIILSDYTMPDFDGLSALHIVKERGLDIPFIMVSGTIGEDVAVNAMRTGAHDYLMKDNLKRLVPAVERELKEAEIRRQRKLTEGELRESEERFRTLADTTATAIFVYSGERFVYVNPASERLTGYKSEELLAKRFWDIVHPDHRELIRERGLARQESEPVIPRYEFRILRKDGAERWVDFTAGKIEWHGTGAAIGSAFDITERKKAEERVKKSEASLRAIFENTLQSFLIIDRDYTIRAFNKTAGDRAKMVFGKEMKVGDSFFRFTSEAERTDFIDNFQKALSGKKILLEREILDSNGKGHWFEVTYSPVHDAEGSENAVFFTVTDIQERKTAELDLFKAEEKFSTIFRLGPDVMTLTSVKEKVITDVNESAVTMTGYGRDELIGNATTGEKIWSDPEARKRFIQNLVEHGSVYNFETRFRAKSGREWQGLISGEMIEIGKEKYVLSVIHDITDIKEAEGLLRQTMNRLIEAEEQLRKEASQQLHDKVGQNLTALIINLSFFRNQLSEDSRKKIEKRLADSLSLLEDTVDRIRDIMTDLRPSILDDYGLYAALSSSAKKLTERTGIPVNLSGKDMEQRLPQEIEYALYRMAQEALHNVIKHAEAGRVTIELKELTEQVRLTITDNGKGFDPEQMAKQKAGKGFGLISISERMKALGGRFEIRSAPGKGTTVVLEI